MIHAYDDFYMPIIRDKIGLMFEICAVYKNKDIDEFARVFVESKMSQNFEINNIKYTIGKSAIELLAIVLDEEPEDILLFEPATAEYWVGYTYAYASWYFNLNYETLFNAIKPSELIMYYFPYHEMDITKSLEIFSKRIKFESKLKTIREKMKYSQNDLSIISNVPIRTIRSYEQGTNDIAKGQVETIYKLAKALDCKIEDLI